MNILIVTPLFPPDIAPAARYAKELAARLQQEHSVSVLHYGLLPEQIDNVRFISVSKRTGVLRRFIHMTTACIRSTRSADIALIHNGPSVELPALVTSFLFRKKIVLLRSDVPAYNRTSTSWFKNLVHKMLMKRCLTTIKDIDVESFIKPIIHPLLPYPHEAATTYESNWDIHLQLYHNL